MYLLRDTLVGHALPELVRPKRAPHLRVPVCVFFLCPSSVDLPRHHGLGRHIACGALAGVATSYGGPPLTVYQVSRAVTEAGGQGIKGRGRDSAWGLGQRVPTQL